MIPVYHYEKKQLCFTQVAIYSRPQKILRRGFLKGIWDSVFKRKDRILLIAFGICRHQYISRQQSIKVINSKPWLTRKSIKPLLDTLTVFYLKHRRPRIGSNENTGKQREKKSGFFSVRHLIRPFRKASKSVILKSF